MLVASCKPLWFPDEAPSRTQLMRTLPPSTCYAQWSSATLCLQVLHLPLARCDAANIAASYAHPALISPMASHRRWMMFVNFYLTIIANDLLYAYGSSDAAMNIFCWCCLRFNSKALAGE
ncbi:hypothetical protein BD410DRAFT_44169 [Rickenella mellea]|uniref:Uncharacterized protein n=1 Tax=Rickenella mellea TaxID=50990 RepID=A0A4R5XHT7_9AGAM|nr:hypothetical protein BD410DRAFT_44169 [Rickenella mellea]